MMAAVLTIVLFAAPSEAVSRVHFAKAQKAFAQHEWKHALDEFAAASESSPEELPDLWFDIGQCHRNLGHPRLAVAAFERYLALKPDAADRERVRGLIVTLGGKPAPDPPPTPDPPPVATLAPAAPAPIGPALVVDTPAPAMQPATATLPLVPPADAPPPAKAHRHWKVWTGVAVGVALVAVGVGLGVGLGTGGGSSMGQGTPSLGSAATFDTRGR
jgi:hypothetical protein